MKNKRTDNKKNLGSRIRRDYYCSNCKLELSKQLVKAFKIYKQVTKEICPFCLSHSVHSTEISQTQGVTA